MKRRYTVRCNYQLRQGSERWRVQDGNEPGAVGGFYFRTKADAQEYAAELEAAIPLMTVEQIDALLLAPEPKRRVL